MKPGATILFSSAQDPRAWDVNAKAVDVVITCLSNADAKKAEMLFNELLVRAETSEAALRKIGYQQKNAMPECKCVFCGKMFPAAEPMRVCLECEASADPRVKDMRVRCRHLEREVESLQRRLESVDIEYSEARNALCMAGVMQDTHLTLADGIQELSKDAMRYQKLRTQAYRTSDEEPAHWCIPEVCGIGVDIDAAIDWVTAE